MSDRIVITWPDEADLWHFLWCGNEGTAQIIGPFVTRSDAEADAASAASNLGCDEHHAAFTMTAKAAKAAAERMNYEVSSPSAIYVMWQEAWWEALLNEQPLPESPRAQVTA